MKRSSHSAKPGSLSESTRRRLDACAFAASAAGV